MQHLTPWVRPLGLGMSFSRLLKAEGKPTPTMRTLPGSGRSLTSLVLPEAALAEAAEEVQPPPGLEARRPVLRAPPFGGPPRQPAPAPASAAPAGGPALPSAASHPVATAFPASRRAATHRPALKRSLSVNEGLDFMDDFDALVDGDLVSPGHDDPDEDTGMRRGRADSPVLQGLHASAAGAAAAEWASRDGRGRQRLRSSTGAEAITSAGDGLGVEEDAGPADLRSFGFELDADPGLVIDDDSPLGGRAEAPARRRAAAGPDSFLRWDGGAEASAAKRPRTGQPPGEPPSVLASLGLPAHAGDQ